MSSSLISTNPYTGERIQNYELYTNDQINQIVEQSTKAFDSWKTQEIEERTDKLRKVGSLLEERKQEYAALITEEMGKPISESIAEIEKCAWLCEFYAVNAEDFLADDLIDTEAQESFISYDPLGCILAIMPWNYPFWQVMRFAAPTLTAGNVALLKHAANVTGCALAIEELFKDAGYPKGCFQTLLTDHDTIEELMANDTVKAVTLTGSTKAGKAIASIAGKNLKKSVLELGGSNACIVWDDADLDTYLDTMVKARMQNTGQSCIAAKRFIVEEGIYDQFLEVFKEKVSALAIGDPTDKDTDITVLARPDLAQKVKEQVDQSLEKGAKLVTGNEVKDAFYQPTIITNVTPGMPVFEEEVFGPVAAIIKVKDRKESIQLANQTEFGLGTMLFTESIEEALQLTGAIEDGAFFINELVKSDPRLPFGGTKGSGYGRELSREGILEFVNKKTVYVK
ncbi:NAD-dependent succinate-semialdehyde dehydrogenase [Aquimarina brevivitae]|uniref:Succinate-semialdehyde dehydrogenase/glutarate-semialdehyde dehydrogenase n=1 Tax=Aquimarina brevivitae TaxID=323412 RepID=A0A4Q7PHJ9_9FLAO|nr:NAD-dependent succinate-semialdehyde dehydrogenase [Aquimarina brevivitae]RZT00052.1 succinate-semialdehyde dehydrogenase/glutarate-semialdehyde dehydrogenase [Aquimarina brevivitae]